MATIGAVTSTASNLQANGMGMQDFLKILLTQLTYQDPLKPMDNQQFMAQMAQFTSLQQTQQLNEKTDALLTTQASLQSIGLTVEIGSSTGSIVGTVTALSLATDTPQLTLKTTDGATLSGISLGQITSVR